VLKNKDRGELFCEMADRALYHLENRMKSTDEETARHAGEIYRKVKEVL
jgi:hypothetical protein